MKKIIDNYKVIAIIGLAKNTGKTTTLNYLLKQYENVGITSIGLDGEDYDQIYFHEKPKIFVKKNNYVVTAINTLKDTNLKYEVVFSFDIDTPLGNLILIKITEEGNLVIAGPTKNNDLKAVISELKKYTNKVFVDGAFNRITFSAINEVEGIVLATGAQVSTNMENTINKTKMLLDLFSLEETKIAKPNSNITIYEEKSVFQLKTKDLSQFENIVINNNKITRIIVLGAVSEKFIDILLKHKIKNYELIFDDATKFLASYKKYEYLKKLNVQMKVFNKNNILFVTINPFRATHKHYDKDIFKEEIQKITNLKVINIKEQNE